MLRQNSCYQLNLPSVMNALVSHFFFFHIVFLFTFFLSFAAKRCREEEEELLVYRNVTVYVRRLTGSERLPEKDMSDPDYEYLNGFGKKQQYAI